MSRSIAIRLALLIDEEEHDDVFNPEFLEHLREKVRLAEEEAARPRTKAEIISEYIATAAGRQSLAEAMTQPIRRRWDYESIGRQIFQVQELPQGAMPIYDSEKL